MPTPAPPHAAPAPRPFPAAPRALLFDLDGTLIDSIELLLRCMEHAFAEWPVPPSREAWTAGIGTPLREQMRAHGVPAADVEALVARYGDFQDAHLESLTRVYDGVFDVLAWARAAGLRTAIVTSKGRVMTGRSLAHVGLADGFDAIVTAHDVARHKPHPEPVDRALALLGVTAGEAVFVGDSTHDMHAGRAAGVATAAALWGPFPRAALAAAAPSRFLDDIRALPAALGGSLDG